MKALIFVLTGLFVFLPCVNSYAGDAEDLIGAACIDDIPTIQALIDKGADVNAKTADGWTALMSASSSGYVGSDGHLKVVQALLAKSADVNAKSNDGWTALMSASGKGHLTVVQALLDKAADVNAKDDAGETALSLAKANGHSDIAELLIKAGVPPTN